MTTTPAHLQQADHLIAAVEEALAAPTSYRDDTPLPRYGTAPPVPQPGRPPMSSKAVDDTWRMLGASAVIATTGGAASAVLWASGQADPTVIGLIAAAPLAVAAPIWALARLVKAATKTTTEHHHHYTGPVRQQTVNSHSRWLGKTTNNL